jgi:formylglycine-generating enzyme required for sulfatase activity
MLAPGADYTGSVLPREGKAGGDCDGAVRRGGSSLTQSETLRAANRLRDNASHRQSDIGFRIAREP